MSKFGTETSHQILIIDDEQEVRELLEHLLHQEGFEVRTVADGAEALDLLQAADGAVDVVVIDIAMPGMDGYQVLRGIQELEVPSLPIVLSSRDDEAAQIRAFNLGAVDYVTKPFSPAVFVARLKRHVTPETPSSPEFPGPWTSGAELVENDRC